MQEAKTSRMTKHRGTYQALVVGLVLVGVGGVRQSSGQPAMTSDAKAEPKAVVPASANTPSVSLASKLEPGMETRFRVIVDNKRSSGQAPTTRQPEPPAAQAMATMQDCEIVRRVRESDARGSTVILMYERVKLRISVDKEAMELDTANPVEQDADKDMGTVLRGVIGKPIEVRLDAQGMVESIEGNQFTFDKLPAAQSLMANDIIRDTLMPLYGLRRSPATARVGQKWTRVDRTPVLRLGTVLATVGHTLEGVKGPMADVAIKGDVELVAAVGSTAWKANVKSASLDGSATWNSELGVVERYRADQKMKYDVETPQGVMLIDNHLTTSIERLSGPTKPSSPAAPVEKK